MSRSEPSLSSFSTAVEAIYDCALDASHWKDALRVIGELTDSPCGGAGMSRPFATSISVTQPLWDVILSASPNKRKEKIGVTSPLIERPVTNLAVAKAEFGSTRRSG